ncbi:sulfite exporter TauE/SafE family protein [Microbulbifer magnicolonia]|uniref:sulfite exporter TauE/SafE family protein n=1 Tax=Microbulbifer magnicolonia TaxID=3109744 RepID=UPI002B417CC0|nr:sulfite exporter TauE/SafE family protein [Microbulbifer sp. GG15]
MIAETIGVGLVVGMVLGLTGAGGSIFAVPLYIVLLGLPINDAMGMSLGAVSAAALTGVLLRNRSRDLAWRPGLLLAVSGMPAAPVGRWLGAQIDAKLLLSGFALLAISLAVRMWQQAGRHRYAPVANALPANGSSSGALLLAGAAAGLLSGLFGVGGGFLIVPLLTLHLGMEARSAVGTSLVVIALVSAAGFAFHLLAVADVPLQTLGYSSLGAVTGIVAGTLLARGISGPRLQKLFAISVVGMMAATLAKTQI